MLIATASQAYAEKALSSLMPVPQSLEAGKGKYRIGADLVTAIKGDAHPRAFTAASRFVRRLDNRTGLFIRQGFVTEDTEPEAAGVIIEVDRPGVLALGEDESYRMEIATSGVRIKAPTDLGALHGLETLLQLLSADEEGYYFPAVTIEDAPRFAWRGLMIDSARHFLPISVIKRNLDGMAAVKMNVMHWHLTEDQGFRIESKRYPKLHEMGSDGFYYTQEQAREIIQYADERGIRVYPEFDVPGHATSWLVGHPELASAPGPYAIERKWGIFDPTLDPTNEQVYELLDGFFGEMATLFPDEYLHIGGDEVTGKHWDQNERIQQFMKDHSIADNEGLQSHFNGRVLEILTKHGKKMIGWDEILQPEMPTNIVIHSWRGREAMVSAAKQGYSSILSNGYYIDLMQPASFHYLNDPLPEDVELSADERERVLGGEATMWSEHVTPETVDSRIWPRSAAIAERLWSPAVVADVEDMYRRLEIISIQLEEHGLSHIKNRGMLMRRLVGGRDYEALEILTDVVEPLKLYQRNADLSYSQFSPYTLLPDITGADARDALAFRRQVSQYLEGGGEQEDVRAFLERWKANHEAFLELSKRSPALREAEPISRALSELAALGLRALNGEAVDDAQAVLAEARRPVARVELQIVDDVERIVNRASASL